MEKFYNEIINSGDRFCKALENIFGKRKKKMKTPLDRDTYIKLAKAYSKQEIYEDKVRESIKAITSEQGIYLDFIGLPVSTSLIMDTVSDILGDEFAFLFYECGGSFDEYNSRITLSDGTHPNAKNLGDLWDYEQKLYGEDNV